MRVDQRSAFTSVRWTNLVQTVGTNVQVSGVAAHKSIGSENKYYEMLRRIFSKIREEHLKMNKNIILDVAVKAVNNSMGPERLILSYLVLGCVPDSPQRNLHFQRNRTFTENSRKNLGVHAVASDRYLIFNGRDFSWLGYYRSIPKTH